MKPFNLKEYLKNPERKVVTRDGRNARIICTDAKNIKYQVVALVTKSKGQEVLATLDASGKYHSGHNSHLDLFFASEKHEGWINIYKSGNCYKGTIIWPTEEQANRYAYPGFTAIKIEWEE